MKPHIKVQNGEATTKSRYNGSYKWQILTEFDVGDEDSFQILLSMVETFGYPTVHMHETLVKPGPCGHYRWNHCRIIDGFDEYETIGERGELSRS